MKPRINAALFDLDGVVVFTDRYHYAAWKRLSDEMGWTFDETVNHRLRGVSRMQSLETILEHNRLTLPQDDRRALADKKNGYYQTLLKGVSEDDLYPGALPFIRTLRERGIKLALCSASRNARCVLDTLGIASLFDTVVTGSDIVRSKPDPEIFLLAAARLGVHPYNCVVLEDAPSGLEAAAAARMKVLGVGNPERFPPGTHCFQDYGRLDVRHFLETGEQRVIPADDPWSIVEQEMRPAWTRNWESLFALTNGYMGVRGSLEETRGEGRRRSYPGVFINGLYGFKPLQHRERWPGYPKQWHGMLNLCDGFIVNLNIDGEPFDMGAGETLEHRRWLDLRGGTLNRKTVWRSPKGHTVEIETTRLVGMTRRHCAAMRYQVTALDFAGIVELESASHIRTHVRSLAETVLEHRETRVRPEADCLLYGVKETGAAVALAWGHAATVSGADSDDRDPVSLTAQSVEARPDMLTYRFVARVRPGATLCLDKTAVFHTTLETDEAALADAVARDMAVARQAGFEGLLDEQHRFWSDFWEQADIGIEGCDEDLQAVRFNLFHLRQAYTPADHLSISACALTGDAYAGHVFWDTEMYLEPFFVYSGLLAEVRALLMYRHGILDRARERAREMDGVGALYAWNSVNGDECGTVFEAATAQYHINSAVAHAIWTYARQSGDDAFLFGPGAEMLFETARFLFGRGGFKPLRGNQFCINVVCGPDEFGCNVDNNCYTNMMAQFHFDYAARVYERMATEAPDRLRGLADTLALTPEEVEHWKTAARNMAIPFDETLRVHGQDDSFLNRDPVPGDRPFKWFESGRSDFHPLNLWRYQVLKQSDVVWLMFVLGDRFTREIKANNYAYYEPLTTHGSSLSPGVHSVIAAEIGRMDDAYDYFRHSALMDLCRIKDSGGGLHSACQGATWMAVVNGFGGFRDYESGPVFDPVLPKAWTTFSFKAQCRRNGVEVVVRASEADYILRDGPGLTLLASGREIALSPGHPCATVPTRSVRKDGESVIGNA